MEKKENYIFPSIISIISKLIMRYVLEALLEAFKKKLYHFNLCIFFF